MPTANYVAALRNDQPDLRSTTFGQSGPSTWIQRKVIVADPTRLYHGKQQRWRKEHMDANLPIGTSKIPNGLLVRNCVEVPVLALDMVALRIETIYLKQHVIIVRFVDNIPLLVDYKS